MTRKLPVVLVVLGALVLIASVISAVVVRSVDTATVALPERPEASVVVTEPGVLSAVDPTVTVRASAESEEPVVLAIGRTSEVEAWLDDAEHARVVGLSSWEELSIEVTTGAPAPDLAEDSTEEPVPDATAEPTEAAEDTTEPAPDATTEPTEAATGLPNPAGSDLWVAEADGTGEVELAWVDRPGRWSLVAATDGTGPAPIVELEWGRSVNTPWLVPGIVVGGLLLLAGGAMLVLDALARREQRQRDGARERQALEWTPTGTGPIATIPLDVHDTDPGTGEQLSRRQIREMERAVADAERRRRRGEVVPPVPRAEDRAAVETDDGALGDTWHVTAPEDAAAAAPVDEVSHDAAETPETVDGVEPEAEADQPEPEPEPEPEPAAEAAGPAAPVPPVPAPVPDDDEIPADGSTPRSPATASAEPKGLRARWVRRRAAGEPRATGPAAPEPAGAAAEPPAAADSTTGAGEPGRETEEPSWRSVWGYGSAPPRQEQATDDDTTDQGEEAR